MSSSLKFSAQKRAHLVMQMLDELFPRPAIPLKHSDPFTLLIAVILSAQCTDVRVNQITPQLFALASSPQKMAALSLATIKKIIHPCGLSERKASAIKRTAQIIAAQFNNMVPGTFTELENLPGVGHKTASVIMSQVFDVPAFPVDTHIHRLAQRWGLSQGKSVQQTEKDLKKLFPPQKWGKLHLQFIYYGREYCPAQGHRLEECPICSKLHASCS